jgi:hypothetical protein
MLLDNTPGPEIASTLGLDGKTYTERVERMIGRLRVAIPAA